jgi:hypothetical protein
MVHLLRPSPVSCRPSDLARSTNIEISWSSGTPHGRRWGRTADRPAGHHGPELLYIPGRAVNGATDGYRGEGKTDARDAFVIADQARLRHDLKPMRPSDEATIELKLFTARRTDLACDRNRAIDRLRGTLTSMFPALERVLDGLHNRLD